MSFLAELSSAWRSVVRSRGSTLVIVLVLGLGVGANTAVLTLVNAVLWKQLPFRDPERLVSIWSRRTDRDKAPLSIADFEDFKGGGTLEDAAAFAAVGANLTGEAEPERLQGVRSTANVFHLLGVRADLGRTLQAADDAPSSPRVVVLSHRLWEHRFGAAPELIGKTLLLNGESYTVVGVLPRDFFVPVRDADFIVPLVPEADRRRLDRGDHFLSALGRLRPGMGVQPAEERLTAAAQRLQRTYPATNNKNSGVRLVSLSEEVIGNFRGELLLLAAAGGVLLLMACSSLANLSLTLASTRRQELAIRSSLGAGRSALVRQLLTETTLKSLIGGMVAMAFAYGGVGLLVALSPPGLPRLGEVRIDGHSLVAALGLAIISGLGIGLLPAFRVSHTALASELRAMSRASTESGSSPRVRNLLSGAQLAFSVLLLVTTGLLVRSFVRLQAVWPGFDPSNVLVLRLGLMQPPFPTPDSLATFYDELRFRMERLPGVQSAGAISILPMSGILARSDFTIKDRPPVAADNTPSANYRVAGPGYFNAMRIVLVSGRDFGQFDTRRTSHVAIVNQSLARRFFADSAAVGAHLLVDGFGTGEVEIVGVVADVKQGGLAEEPGLDLYVPYAQAPAGILALLRNNMFWVIHSGQDPLSLSMPARRAVHNMNRDVAIASTMALDQYLGASVAPRRFNLVLLIVFAVSAMLLAVIAIYGVVSYSVSRRTREIGLRVALGAQRAHVLVLVMGQGLWLTVAGVGAGLAGTAIIIHFVADLLYQTDPFDVLTFATVSLLLVAGSLAASYLPARRALRVDPLTALRED